METSDCSLEGSSHLCDYGTVKDTNVVFECTDEALLNSRRNNQSLISQSERKIIPLHCLMCCPEVEGRDNQVQVQEDREKLPLFIHEENGFLGR